MLRSPGILPTMETIFTEINRSSLAGTIRKLKLNFNKNIYFIPKSKRDFPGGSIGKESACNAGDSSSVPGWERSPGEGNGNPLYYSCLENFMDRGTWCTTVDKVAKESDMT